MLRGRCYHWLRLPAKRVTPFPATRLYSVLRASSIETVKATCGSSGHVELKIHNNNKGRTSGPVIIHLPPLSIGNPSHQVPVPNALLAHTVIQIYPRWAPTHFFPNPIHDTLHAYSWILEYLTQQTHHGPPRPIAVYGENLCGTIATSLALTESRPSLTRPYISALAVKDCLFDWSKIASSSPPPSAQSPPPNPLAADLDPPPHSQDLAELYALRSQLFRDPGSAFDAFASPLLFFRTTGLAIPSSFPNASPSPSSSSQSPSPSPSQPKTIQPATASAFVTRKSHLTFPPKRSGLRIPETRIAVSGALNRKEGGVRGEEGKGAGRGKKRKGEKEEERGGEKRSVLLHEQAEEMVRLMRRSVMVHEGKERGNGGFDGVAEAERRVALVELDGLDGKADDGMWAAEFFEEVLGNGMERV